MEIFTKLTKRVAGAEKWQDKLRKKDGNKIEEQTVDQKKDKIIKQQAIENENRLTKNSNRQQQQQQEGLTKTEFFTKPPDRILRYDEIQRQEVEDVASQSDEKKVTNQSIEAAASQIVKKRVAQTMEEAAKGKDKTGAIREQKPQETDQVQEPGVNQIINQPFQIQKMQENGIHQNAELELNKPSNIDYSDTLDDVDDDSDSAAQELQFEEILEEEYSAQEEQLTEGCNRPPRKYAFKLKPCNNGNILTVHHTIKEKACLIRIRIAVCCFNEQATQIVIIDKRGNTFAFDFVSKHYWRLNFLLPNASVICASKQYNRDFIVGNKFGQLFLIDVENSICVKSAQLADNAIEELSFCPRNINKPRVLLRFGHEALLLNLRTFLPTHRLEFDQVCYALKFASYLPKSDQILTGFTNDSLHIWSTQTLNILRTVHPIRKRDKKLRLLAAEDNVPEFTLSAPADIEDHDDDYPYNCQDQDFSNGYMLNYCFTPDGNKLCLSTLDGYVILLNTQTYDLEKIFRLRDFVLKQVQFMQQPKERIICGLTFKGQVLLLDLCNTAIKLIVQSSGATSICLSPDGRLLAIVSKQGELNIWSTCRLYNMLHSQEQCMTMLKVAIKQKKPLPPCSANECMHEDLRKLLKRERLTDMLSEFGCYPNKYRQLIWTVLLQLPCNVRQFQNLMKLGTPNAVQQRAKTIKVKNDSLKRTLIRIWSCLSHWCKVFAYADFMPDLIFPFVKTFPKNSLVCFELIVSLLLNHFSLWFEFHPMEPSNYMAICQNLLQNYDMHLCKYFAVLELTPKDYIWPLLANGFAEVLDEEQWLCLWDNILTQPPYFLIFVTIAYNIMQREILLRLPDKAAILLFFHEQNPIDVSALLCKARSLASKCTAKLHPKRYISAFKAIPKDVYPKFLNYPNKWINRQEQKEEELQKQHMQIEARIRQIELEEMKLVQRLEDGLKQEEHVRRVKEMEKLYQNVLRNEEERVAYQRKVLLLYQKEIRNRKCKVVSKLKESEQRRKVLEMEKDIDALIYGIEQERKRNNQELLLAEDEIRDHEIELLAQKYDLKMQCISQPLAQKFYENVKKLHKERRLLENTLMEMSLEKMQSYDEMMEFPLSTELTELERSITEIQEEFTDIISRKNNRTSHGNSI